LVTPGKLRLLHVILVRQWWSKKKFVTAGIARDGTQTHRRRHYLSITFGVEVIFVGSVLRMGFVLVLVRHPVLAALEALQGWLQWTLRDRSWLVASK